MIVVMRAMSKYWVGKYAMHAGQMRGASYGPMPVLSLETVVIICLAYLGLLSASKSSCCSSPVLSVELFQFHLPLSYPYVVDSTPIPCQPFFIRCEHALSRGTPRFLYHSLPLLLLGQ
jgi:hypothetical protein